MRHRNSIGDEWLYVGLNEARLKISVEMKLANDEVTGLGTTAIVRSGDLSAEGRIRVSVLRSTRMELRPDWDDGESTDNQRDISREDLFNVEMRSGATTTCPITDEN